MQGETAIRNNPFYSKISVRGHLSIMGHSLYWALLDAPEQILLEMNLSNMNSENEYD